MKVAICLQVSDFKLFAMAWGAVTCPLYMKYEGGGGECADGDTSGCAVCWLELAGWQLSRAV